MVVGEMAGTGAVMRKKKKRKENIVERIRKKRAEGLS